MYYLVDKEKLKTIYFNQLSAGEIEKPDAINLKNIEYKFDKNFELKFLRVVNYNEKAFVLTTNGYVEYLPSYSLSPSSTSYLYGKVFSLNYIEKNTEFLDQEDKTFDGHVIAYPICSGYICIDYPKDAHLVLDYDFFVEYEDENQDGELDVYSAGNIWVLDLSRVEKPAYVGVQVDDRFYKLFRVENSASELFIKKGLCVYILNRGKILCL